MAVSKYLQIKEHLLQQIESGVLPEHALVPSENTLAQAFGVSRMTARRALQELAEQGVVVRTQGARSAVASIKSQSSLLEIRNIADEIAARGHQHSARCLDLAKTTASPAIANHLGVAQGAAVFYSQVLHLENGVPIQLEQRYVNPTAAPGYLQQDFNRLTTHDYLVGIAPLTEAEHVVEAVMPDPVQADLLALAGDSPCLRVTRRTWSKLQSVSYAILIHPGNRYRLGGHLTFSSK